MPSLQERLDAAPYTADGYPLEGWGTEPPTVVTRDARIYGEGSPWWGPARLDTLEIAQCRVTLERLTVGGLWLRNAYLSTVRDVVCTEGGLRIGPDPTDDRLAWPSAITLSGVHVREGPLLISAANVCWHGGSVERTVGSLELGAGKDVGSIILTGVRFEHDNRRKLTIRGPSPVTLVGCHFTSTDVEIVADAHPESKLIGCSHTMSQVIDHRPRKRWWQL